MTAPEFQVGEVVDIHITGARVLGTDDVGLMRVLVGNWQPIFNLRNDGVAVTRVGPANWPPIHGDLWVDHEGEEWIALLRKGELVMRMVNDNEDTAYDILPGEMLEKYGPVRLVRRRETP